MRQPIGLSLALLPTPLHSLPNLSSSLGVELWTKRDDLTGLAFGGNKTRKLQWLVKDAKQKGATVLITTGAPQSNHCRQTAAAAKVAGMNCVLVLGGNGSRENTGNLLLDHLLGAEIRWLAQSSRSEMMQSVAAERRGEGEIPYVIPLGGSNGLGAASYIEATHELAAQVDKPFDFIVFASSSGGTQTGIAAGVCELGWKCSVLGISVEKDSAHLVKVVEGLWESAFQAWGNQVLSLPQIQVKDEFLGEGYAKAGTPEFEAIRRFAQEDGLVLDPVYTGRAAAGLLKLVERGEIPAGSRVLFWHTGGTPALFPYAAEMMEYLDRSL